MIAWIIIGLCASGLFGWVLYHWKTAPLGWQDELGFHYGEPPKLEAQEPYEERKAA